MSDGVIEVLEDTGVRHRTKWTVDLSDKKRELISDTWIFGSEKWFMSLILNVDTTLNSRHLSLYLHHASNGSCDVSFRLWRTTSKDVNSCYFNRRRIAFDGVNDRPQGSSIIVKEANLASKKGILGNNVQEMFCLQQLGELAESSQPSDDFLLRFCGIDIGHMDVDTTVVVGSQQFKVHRFALEAHSKVFAAMFRHNLSESQTNTVTIEDCDPSVFEVFLRFIYSGTVGTLMDGEAHELYALADKYSVDRLKQACKDAMKLMSIYNAIDTLILADKYGEDSLKEDAIEFIKRFPRTIKEKWAWESLRRCPVLMETIICELAEEITNVREQMEASLMKLEEQTKLMEKLEEKRKQPDPQVKGPIYPTRHIHGPQLVIF